VLESKHVIGLFLLMLLFSGVFFTLGYVMGRNQYEGQVRAAITSRTASEPLVSPKVDTSSKHTAAPPSAGSWSDPATPSKPNWDFYQSNNPKPAEPHLKPAAPAPKPQPVSVTTNRGSAPAPSKSGAKNSLNAPLIPGGSYVLQVAALTKESDALSLAASLQKKKFPAYVLSPQTDKYYRVQVGPYTDQKAADAAKKGLEGAGFKAIVKH
jgi:DedD protein